MKAQFPGDVSQFSAQLLNAALAMSLEWGENWLKPIERRIQIAYPEIGPVEARNLESWCREVKRMAFERVAEEYPLALENRGGAAMEAVQQKYPQIDADNLLRLYNQGMYYAWHG